MRSFASGVAAMVMAAALGAAPHAQSSTQPQTLYNQALERETLLRREIDAHRAPAPVALLLQRVRALTSAYEDMSRLFPTSAYSDNALWQGALLSAAAFWQFGEDTDRMAALRLLDALKSRFPTSTLVKQVPAQTKRLTDARGTVSSTSPSASPSTPPAAAVAATSGSTVPRPAPAAGPAARTPSAAAPSTVALRVPAKLASIRREVLPEALRITLELGREVSFHQERLEGPPRVFIDLLNTRAVEGLKDATIPFPDDVVRQVRIGRQQDARTRVVLDLDGAGRYSVYTLYDPYRVVIDFERASASTRTSVPPEEPRSAPVRPVPAAPVAAASHTPATAPAVTPATDPIRPPTPPSLNRDGTFSLSRQLGLGIARIVIDPGHGGHDPGTTIKGLTEADLVLDVALRLEKLLVTQLGVEVVLTRRTNAYVALEERTDIANRAGADLFLSIHVNASGNATARGVETYFLNFAPNPAAEAIAARENAGSARTMRNLPDIVRAIALNNKIDESRDFASALQASLHAGLRRANANTRNLGVKQAPFMVLIGATMPSALAELAFITNRQEANLLKTDKYRQQIAEALFAGIARYQQSLKKAPAVATR